MKRSKTLQLLVIVGAFAVALGGTKLQQTLRNNETVVKKLEAKEVQAPQRSYDIPENAAEIGSKADFQDWFKGTAANNTKNLVLTADIDLEGLSFVDTGRTGAFAAIFEGQGYTLKNFNAKSLFSSIGAAGTVRNLNIEYNAISSHQYGGLTKGVGGTIENVRTKIFLDETVTLFGGISGTALGTASIKNCHADFIFKEGAAGSTLYTIVNSASDKDVENCSWTMIDYEPGSAITPDLTAKHNPEDAITHDFIREGALGFSLWIMGYEGGDEITPECEAKWDAALLKWGELSEDSREQVRELAEFEDAWLRFLAWGVANDSTPDAGIGASFKAPTDSMIGTTLIIGLIGLTTILGYSFLVRLKKVKA